MAIHGSGACPEYEVIQKNLSKVVDRIATTIGPLRLSMALQEEGFISTEIASDKLSTMGSSNAEKVFSLMEPVILRFKTDRNPSQPFGAFIKILQSQPSLEDLVKALDDDYQELLSGKKVFHSVCQSYYIYLHYFS